LEPVYKLIDTEKRISILDHLFVEYSIVYAHFEITAFFSARRVLRHCKERC